MNMIKKLRTATVIMVALLLLLMIPLTASAESSVSDFTYTNDSTSVTITGYVGSGGDVVIPGTIEGLPVIAIGDNAFKSITTITSVIIPDNVTSIGNSAFYGCSGLTSVTIPDSVTSIGTYAFRNCAGLTSVVIPDSVTSTGTSVFMDCTSLTSVTIGSGLTSISDSMFKGCSGLTSVTIPDNVISISNNAFRDCIGLTSVTFGNGLTSIGSYVFYGCTGLTSVDIPDSVISIGSYAFRDCTGLTSVDIPDSVTSIGDRAFYGCSVLPAINVNASNSAYSSVDGILYDNNVTTLIVCPGGKSGSVTIPGTVTSISSYALRDCTGLTSVVIPNSVTLIGNYAFYGCSGLTSVTMGNGVTSIDSSAFRNCISLTSVTIPSSVTDIGSYVFRDCTALSSVTISDGVTSIGSSMFRGCNALTSVTIPSSVTDIGSYAFRDCTSLTEMVFEGDAPSLGSSWISGCTNLVIFYQPGATGFTTPTWEGVPCYPEGLIFTDNSTSLQETIYAAQNGDTIMMAPGIYEVSSSDPTGPTMITNLLYINKSDLTFIADGGEVVIVPDPSISVPAIEFGRDEHSDLTGCDATGLVFEGITFGLSDRQFKHVGWRGPSNLLPNQDFSNTKYEDCTIYGMDNQKYALSHNSSVMNCTFYGDFTDLMVYGDNILIENNRGTGLDISDGNSNSYICSNLIVRNNVLTNVDIDYEGGTGLLENNVFDGVVKLYLYDEVDNNVYNNEFLNCSGRIRLGSHVYMNDFTDSGSTDVRLYAGGNCYENNFIGFIDTDFTMDSGVNLNTSTPVSYTYDGTSYTGYLGNYYSAYTGNDTNGDGVGEDVFSLDAYPLMGAWDAATSTIEEPAIIAPVADFSVDVTSGNETLTVQFTDLSVNEPDTWAWDFDNDGVTDSTDQNPQYTYTAPGVYTVSLNASNAAGSDVETKVDYITVGDWNPWNDPNSDGLPDGTYITIDEVIEAYGCYIEFSPAPGTGASVDIDMVIEMYAAYIEDRPME